MIIAVSLLNFGCWPITAGGMIVITPHLCRKISMTPEELAGLCPKLLHLTDVENLASIQRSGLLPTVELTKKYGAPKSLLENRRNSIRLEHPVHGVAVINDNKPLSNSKLARCLDDGLTVEDWLLALNQRVFFFVRSGDVQKLRLASANRQRSKLLLVFDALPLLQQHFSKIEISPINSGNTNHQPARRGLDTFTRALSTDYSAWRRRRKKASMDTIKEIAVNGSVANAADYLLATELI